MPAHRKLPPICIAATGRTASELMECATRALEDSRFIELRLDWTPQPQETVASISTLLAKHTHLHRATTPVLQATCRRTPNGGRFRGSVARQFQILEDAASSPFFLL